MSGENIKDCWKSIPIHQNYTIAYNKVMFMVPRTSFNITRFHCILKSSITFQKIPIGKLFSSGTVGVLVLFFVDSVTKHFQNNNAIHVYEIATDGLKNTSVHGFPNNPVQAVLY